MVIVFTGVWGLKTQRGEVMTRHGLWRLFSLLVVLSLTLTLWLSPRLLHSSVALVDSRKGDHDWQRECGDKWQASYTALHNAIMSGQQPLRVVVSLGVKAGAADRLTGLVTEFLYALVTRRAFVHTTAGDVSDWNVVYDYASINMTIPPLESKLVAPLKYMEKEPGPRYYDDSVDLRHFYPLHLVNDDTRNIQLYEKNNMSTSEGSEAAVVVMSSNRGRSYAIFKNPHHRNQLLEMGLRPTTTFGCVMNFLFKLRPSSCDATCRATEIALKEAGVKGVLRIAIHVRVGDAIFEHDDARLTDAEEFFACAEEVARTRAMPGQPVLFYLISDSLSLRQEAKVVYGDRLLTDTTTVPMHAACAGRDEGQGGCPSLAQALANAVAQLHLFSLADVHIISAMSGFGAVGAWMSAQARYGHPPDRTRAIYRVDTGFRRPCGVSDADSPEQVTSHWSNL